ncbi:MAG: prepilin-type N-terminal cleavage/methylation domain-containing protein [Elusimicrobiota bacterium]|nr:prepilin-type N-terminal cleavage/methylation domain-containing protein [Elusimicrobiota bacterium]
MKKLKDKSWDSNPTATARHVPLAKHGYTLVEIMIAMVVLVLGLIPLVKLIGDSLVATSDLGSRSVANELSQDLMEEIKQRKWDEGAGANGFTAAPSATLGITPAETAQGETASAPNGKTTFDDIDDYNLGSTGTGWGWTENPPRDASNVAMGQYSKFTRNVRVRYMRYDAPTQTFVEDAVVQDYKRIEVNVSWRSGSGKTRSVVHQTIMANIARR